MADNVLAQVPRKRYPTLDEQMRSDIVNYLSRLKSDFVTSGERAGQGLGQVIDDGNYLEGVPRVVLGGLGALSAPVSAAVSPVLGPLLQPVGEAVDTYVGQPIEQATGYPADITNELFLTGVTAGAAPVLRPALRGSGNFLAKVGDAAEAGLNRMGYTARPQAGTFFSGGGPVKLADDVAEGGGLLQQSADVGSGVGLRPNAGEAIDATNSVFRAHPADSQVTGNMRLSPKLSSVDNLKEMLDDLGFKVEAHERSTSNTETFGPSASQYLMVVAPNGKRMKVRLSDHDYLAPDGGVDLRYSNTPEIAQEQLLLAAGMDVPDGVRQAAEAARNADTAAKQAANAAKVAAENEKKLPRIQKALDRAENSIGKNELDRLVTLARSSNPGANAARKQLQQFGLFQSEFSLIDMLPSKN